MNKFLMKSISYMLISIFYMIGTLFDYKLVKSHKGILTNKKGVVMTSVLDRIFDDMFDTFLVPYNKTKVEPEPVHLELELAGVKKEEIKISTDEGFLRVQVDSKRRKGSRIVSLTGQHDVDKINAKYENGLLTVDIPLRKLDKKETKLIAIA